MKTVFKNTRPAGQWIVPALLVFFTFFLTGKTFGTDRTDTARSMTYSGSVTYSTEPLPARNILNAEGGHLCYVLKVVTTAEVSLTSISVKTAGTYTIDDIARFTIDASNSASLANVFASGSDGTTNGGGETLNFNIRTTLEANSTTYFLVTAYLRTLYVTNGRTFGINGADNDLTIVYNAPVPEVINNQTDVSELQTFRGPYVTYTTEPLGIENVGKGATDRLLYVLKIEAGFPAPVSFDNLAVKTRGTYSGSDVSQFKLWRSNTPGLTGASVVGTDESVTGNGEILSFAGSQTIAQNTRAYFLVTADVPVDAVTGRTFGIDGSNNALDINYTGPHTFVTDNQTDAAALRTIVASSVTYATEPLSPGKVQRRTTDHPLYILKVTTGSTGAVSFDNFNIRTDGNYTATDIGQFKLWRNSTPGLAGATAAGTHGSVTGHGETLSFAGSQTLAANSTTYFLVTADINADAVFGRTLGINGVNNALNITYSNPPDITDIQTNTAGFQTITQAAVTYFTEPLSFGNAPQGTADHLLYVLKVVTDDVGAQRISHLGIATSGSYAGSDISQFRLWRSNTSNLAGATAVGTDGSVTGHGETLSFSLEQPAVLEAGSTTYFLVTADVSPKAEGDRTFGIKGTENALDITYSIPPRISDHQSDLSDLQTIIQPTVTYTTGSLPAGNTTRGTFNRILYILKVATSDVGSVSLNNLSLVTYGTYTDSDISQFKLWRSNDSNLAMASLIGTDESVTGHGETLSFSPGQPAVLNSNSTTFLLVTANITSDAAHGSTFGINGAENTLQITYATNPHISDNQSNLTGLQTIVAPSVTYSTEPVPATGVAKGASRRLMYVLKVVTGISNLSFDNFTIKTTGTYSKADISQFSLWKSDSPGFPPASSPVAGTGSATGAGEILAFPGHHTIPAHSTVYFGITADVAEDAVTGNTFGINGADNAFNVTYSDVFPSVLNNQTDVAGLQTIGIPSIIYTTESLSADNSFRGTDDNLLYILKVVTSDAGPTHISHLSIRTGGTYTGSDIRRFKLWSNDTPGMPGAALVAADESVTGNGETLSFSGSQIFPENTATYLLVTADVKPDATAGRTYGINGADNALDITYADPKPPVADSQTDAAGLRTIVDRTVTYSAEPIMAENVAQGELNRTVYILKVVTGSEGTTEINNLTIKTTGTYTGSDIGPFELRRSNTLNTGWIPAGQYSPAATGTGEVLSFPFETPLILTAGSTTYFAIVTNVKEGAASGRTFGIDGSDNGLVINYLGSPSPVVTNNQTNVAGLLTIGASNVTITSEPVPAQNVRQGAVNHPVYAIKLVMGSIGATLSRLRAYTAGTYEAGDFISFNLYRNDAGTSGEDVLIGTDDTLLGAGEPLDFDITGVSLPAGSTTYLKIKANVSSTATVNRTFHIHGSNPYPTVSFSGVAPSIANNQSNAAGIQTIRPADECFTGLIIGESALCLSAEAHTIYSNPTASDEGRWSSSDESVLTISEETGEARPLAAGTVMVRYTVPSDCNPSGFIYAEKEVRVNSAGKIELPQHVCLEEGERLALNLVGEPGGVWSSGMEYVATVSDDGKYITLLSAGYTTISYTVSFGGCISKTEVGLTVSDPAGQELYIPDLICVMEGDKPLVLTPPFLTEGSWGIAPLTDGSAPAIASIGTSTGVLTVTGSGTVTVEYEVSSPCSYKLSKTIMLNYLRPIAGPESILVNSEEDWLKKYEYSSANPPGGTWTSLNPAVATIDQNGKLTPVGLGITALTYVNNADCEDKKPGKLVYIQSNGIMSGSSEICEIASGPYQYSVTNSTPGGRWTTGNSPVGVINQNGVFTPLSPGEVTITYTPPGGNLIVEKTVKVFSAGTLWGPRNVCLSEGKFTYGLSDPSSYTGEWTSGNPEVASVDPAGEVSLLTAGTTTITYTIETAACGKISVSTILNVSESAPGVQFHEGYQVIAAGTNPLVDACTPVGTINSPALASSSAPWLSVLPSPLGEAAGYRLAPYRPAPDTSGDYAADLVLYFYQEDFNIFNKVRTIKLPTGPSDRQGIANLRIYHISLSGYPNEIIRPGMVTWNADKMRWEVAFSTTHFSIFSLSAEETILPVTLVNFSAFKEEQHVRLRWTTSMETNSEVFEVQHSSDGKQWQPAGAIAAGGESGSVKNYTFLHQNPPVGRNYYRLKIVDMDKSFTYSRIQSAWIDRGSDVRIFPNPVSDHFTVETADWKNVGSVKIHNLNGITVYDSDSTGLSRSVDVRSVGVGVYVVELLFRNGQTKTSRIVIVK